MHRERSKRSVSSVRKALRLSDYLEGQTGLIVEVQGDAASRRRMSEMGFIRGSEVKVVKDAPLKDPVEYLVKGYHVSLRRDQAAQILMDRPKVEQRSHE
jgi:Fe2+ transport system protein FeoA